MEGKLFWSLWGHPWCHTKEMRTFPRALCHHFAVSRQVPSPVVFVEIAKITAERWFRQIFLFITTLCSSPHKNISNTFDGFLLPCRNLWTFFFWRISDDGSSLFAFLGSTPHNSELLYNKNHISLFTQRISASQDSRAEDLSLLKFPPRRPLPKKDPLAKNEFVQENVSPYLARVHVVWQSADTPEFNHLGNLF